MEKGAPEIEEKLLRLPLAQLDIEQLAFEFDGGGGGAALAGRAANNAQGMHIKIKTGLKPAGFAIDRTTVEKGPPGNPHRFHQAWLGSEHDNRQRRYRAEVMREEHRAQAMDQFGNFVVNSCADQASEKGHPFQQPFHIRVA